MNGKYRSGYRVKTAQGAMFVALLGRRCTSRLVPSESLPTAGTADYAKFFLESTNVFNISAIGALYFLHHSSADVDDVFFFSLAPIMETSLVEIECATMTQGVSETPGWCYLRIDKIET